MLSLYIVSKVHDKHFICVHVNVFLCFQQSHGMVNIGAARRPTRVEDFFDEKKIICLEQIFKICFYNRKKGCS